MIFLCEGDRPRGLRNVRGGQFSEVRGGTDPELRYKNESVKNKRD